MRLMKPLCFFLNRCLGWNNCLSSEPNFTLLQSYGQSGNFSLLVLRSLVPWISVQFSQSVVSNSFQYHGLQQDRLPCLSSTPKVYSNSCSLSWWCHPTISAPVIPFSSRFQFFQCASLFKWVSSSHSVQFSSLSQSCPTLCDPMNCSIPGLPVHHQLTEFTQTHIHRAGDAIQPSHPLSSPSPPSPNPSKHQSLFQWVNSSHEVAKVLEFQLQHHSFQRTLMTDLLFIFFL